MYSEQNSIYFIFIPSYQFLALQKIDLSVGKKSCVSNMNFFFGRDENPDDRNLDKLGAGLFKDNAGRE